MIIWEADIYHSGKSCYVFVYNCSFFGHLIENLNRIKWNWYNTRIYYHWAPPILRKQMVYFCPGCGFITWWCCQWIKKYHRSPILHTFIIQIQNNLDGSEMKVSIVGVAIMVAWFPPMGSWCHSEARVFTDTLRCQLFTPLSEACIDPNASCGCHLLIPHRPGMKYFR